jgi:transcription elongation factor Elf1
MVNISRRVRDDKNFTCPHCATIYEVLSEVPARDSGSADCQVCHEIMIRWNDSDIPSFRVKNVG